MNDDLYRAVFERACDGLIVVDASGALLGINPAAAALFGRPITELLSRPPPQLSSLLDAGQDGDVELERPDGTRRHVELVHSGSLEGGRRLLVLRDATERKSAERELRDSQRKLLEAQHVGHVGSWEWDVVSDVVSWSDELYRIFGLSPQQFGATLGGYLERVHPDDREAVLAHVERSRETLEPFDYEARVIRPDGSFRTIQAIGEVVIDPQGRPVRMVGTAHDVTERRQLEQQLRQAARMEAVGRLAGGVAHDFNNLLTAILGYGDLLLEQLAENDPRRNSAEQIRLAADRGAALVQQLLAFSRRQLITPEVLDLGLIVKDMSKLLWRLIGEDIALVTLVHPEVAPIVADRGHVAQVILNLAVNARDAMPRGGKLVLEVRNAAAEDATGEAPATFEPERFVALLVSDTGVGMDAETRRRIFEPFFTTKEQGQGSGLGLATVYGILEQSGGHIRVETAPGSGTLFRVFFPRASGPVTEREEVQKPAAMGSETILLVEDEDGVRRLAREVLSGSGYTVLEAASGVDALRTAAAAGAIDLVVTDVVMPGMSGRQLVERLASTRPGIRIVYMSGYTDDAVVRRGVQADRVTFLKKPFTAADLRRVVRRALDARQDST